MTRVAPYVKQRLLKRGTLGIYHDRRAPSQASRSPKILVVAETAI